MILNKEWITDFFRLREPLRNMIRKLASSCVLPYPRLKVFFTTASTYLLTSEHIGTVTIVFWLLMKWTCIILELR